MALFSMFVMALAVVMYLILENAKNKFVKIIAGVILSIIAMFVLSILTIA